MEGGALQEETSSALSCLTGAGSIGEVGAPSPSPPRPPACLHCNPCNPRFFLQNAPEGHLEEHTQVPVAAFLGLVEALHQGEDLGPRFRAQGPLGGGRPPRELQGRFGNEGALEEECSLLSDRGGFPPEKNDGVSSQLSTYPSK